jgi:hypothetical protein
MAADIRNLRTLREGRDVVNRSEHFGTGQSTPRAVVKIDDLTKSHIGEGWDRAELANYVTLVDFYDGGVFKETTPNIAGRLRTSSMVTIDMIELIIRRDEQYPIYRMKATNGDVLEQITIQVLDNIKGVYQTAYQYVYSDNLLELVQTHPSDSDLVVLGFRTKTVEVTQMPRDNEGLLLGNVSNTFNTETGQNV